MKQLNRFLVHSRYFQTHHVYLCGYCLLQPKSSLCRHTWVCVCGGGGAGGSNHRQGYLVNWPSKPSWKFLAEEMVDNVWGFQIFREPCKAPQTCHSTHAHVWDFQEISGFARHWGSQMSGVIPQTCLVSPAIFQMLCVLTCLWCPLDLFIDPSFLCPSLWSTQPDQALPFISTTSLGGHDAASFSGALAS